MEILLPAILLIGLVGALLLMLVSITVARIASPYPVLVIVAVGISGVGSAAAVLAYWNSSTASSVWWWNLLAVTTVGMSVFAAVLTVLVSGGIVVVWDSSDEKPPTAGRALPGLHTVAMLLVVASVFVVIDLQMGLQGWGLRIGFVVLVFGLVDASLAPIYRYYLRQRLVDIDDFEPELLASLNHGAVSRRVLNIIRRWTEVEKESG